LTGKLFCAIVYVEHYKLTTIKAKSVKTGGAKLWI
jgi:hypothetical protein